MLHDAFHRPLRDVRISLIDRCNFRCPYCMPEEKFGPAYQFLSKNEWLSFDEIERLARIFVLLGASKLRLTGGEPLLRPDIDVLVGRLALIEGVDDLALTTNGSMLCDWAPRLHRAGLKRLSVSLDTLDPQIFRHLSGGRGNVDDVLGGIKAAEDAGFRRLKINAVVKRGVNDHTVLDLVRFFRGTGHVLRFIEYMDVGTRNQWRYEHVVPSHELVRIINGVYPMEQLPSAAGGETALRYVFKDGGGEIGFISSVSQAFCGTCNRLRLSADGKIYTCLFATRGTDLRALLRSRESDAALAALIQGVWSHRDDRYSQMRTAASPASASKIEMYHIGG